VSPKAHYDAAMLHALASSLGVSDRAAAERLDSETRQQNRLSALERQGVATDGSFFDAKGALVINAESDQAAHRLEDAGLRARTAHHGADELNKIKAQLDAAAVNATPTGVSSWEVDLATDTVTVKVIDSDASAARSFLRAARAHGDAVRILSDQRELVPQAVIKPGAEMAFKRLRLLRRVRRP
jgi:hypothetical protein